MVFLNWFGRVLFGCCAIAAAWSVWYVIYLQSHAAIAESEKPKPEQVIAVEVVAAQQDMIEERIELVGNLLPVAQTEIRSRVDGYIVELPFDVGDRVSSSQTLCRIDDSGQQEALDKAKATLKAAEAQLRVQESQYRFAQKSVEREERLASRGAGTDEQLETAYSNNEIAQAQVELEQARVAEAKADVNVLEIGLKDFSLSTPISGYVASRMVDIGDLAKPDVPLLQIVDLETVKTTVNIIEKDYRKVAVGQAAMVTVDAYPERTFIGEVKRISPVLDQETRTVSAQIEIKNQNSLLKPGMYARVSLNSEQTKSSVIVPLSAVLEINGREAVYLVNSEGKTELRQVRLGSSDGLVTEVLEGVEAGEIVITLGNRLVKPGQVVIAEQQQQPWGLDERALSSGMKSTTDSIDDPDADLIADPAIDPTADSAPLAGE